jgi:hypothetical protein
MQLCIHSSDQGEVMSDSCKSTPHCANKSKASRSTLTAGPRLGHVRFMQEHSSLLKQVKAKQICRYSRNQGWVMSTYAKPAVLVQYQHSGTDCTWNLCNTLQLKKVEGHLKTLLRLGSGQLTIHDIQASCRPCCFRRAA